MTRHDQIVAGPDGDHTGPSASTRVVILPVVRQDRMWITRPGEPGEHAIIVAGRTLRDLHTCACEALALLHRTDPSPLLRLKPESAELGMLARHRRNYNAALAKAVRQLRASGATWSDVAQACEVRIADAQAVTGDTPSG